MTDEHTVTRVIERRETQRVERKETGLYVEEITDVEVETVEVRCTCGAVLESPEEVAEHL